MRIGVLDAGSNTVHLAVVDGQPGSPPLPVATMKHRLRLAHHIDETGSIDEPGVQGLVDAVRQARGAAERHGVEELFAFATAAIRDASDASQILNRVRQETGIRLDVMGGDDEARLTFVAVRRWLGCLRWDTGGDVRPVGSSRTLQQLARLCGAPRRRDGIFVNRHLPARRLERWIPRLAQMTAEQRSRLRGISRARAGQALAGAIVAQQLMLTMGVVELEISPWALREGVILQRLDRLLSS